MIKTGELEDIVDGAISTLTKIDVIYRKSDSEQKRRIIQYIYPEKLYENLQHRTAEASEAFKDQVVII